MNRNKLLGLAAMAFAFCITMSCSDRQATAITGIALNDPAGDAALVASASVTLGQSSLEVGQTTQATALLFDWRGQLLGWRIVWSSSSNAIATVSLSGLVTGKSPGSAVITATRGWKSGSAIVTVIPSSVVNGPAAVASVSVNLTASALNVGQTTQAVAVTRDSSNNVLIGRAVVWSSSDVSVATISTSGLVMGLAAGATQIAASSEGRAGVATLSVTVPAPVPVATVTVLPASSSLIVGATVQLSATTRDASGTVLTGRVVTWSSSNAGIASVNSSGLATGVNVGSATITATSESRIGTASFSATAAPPPPPPPPSGSSNEPAGMTFINERTFATQNDPAWYYTNGVSIVSDGSAPKSPSSIGRVTYPAGAPSGSSPGHTDFAFGSRPRHTVYVSHWGRLSSNWYGDASGTNKICYFWSGNLIPFFVSADGAGNSALVPVVKTQALIVPAGNQNYGPNLVPSARITRGQWFHLEIVARGNSAGRADGSIDWYLNGAHVGSINGIQFTNDFTQWSEYRWYPVWGGSGGPSVPATQWHDVDNIYISGQN